MRISEQDKHFEESTTGSFLHIPQVCFQDDISFILRLAHGSTCVLPTSFQDSELGLFWGEQGSFSDVLPNCSLCPIGPNQAMCPSIKTMSCKHGSNPGAH